MVFGQSQAALEVTVARRPLAYYDRLAGLAAPPDPAGAAVAEDESLVGAA
jgi:hypothetical protein